MRLFRRTLVATAMVVAAALTTSCGVKAPDKPEGTASLPSHSPGHERRAALPDKPADICGLLKHSETAITLRPKSGWHDELAIVDSQNEWIRGCASDSGTFLAMTLSGFKTSEKADLGTSLQLDEPRKNKDWWREVSGPGEQTAVYADTTSGYHDNGAAMRVGKIIVGLTARKVDIDRLIAVLRELVPAVEELQ